MADFRRDCDEENASEINVAIVEDDDSVRRSLMQLLRAAGFNPLGYATGEQFLKDSTPGKVQCLILDIQLESMLGFDLQNELKARDDLPPVIFITAQEDPAMRRRAKESGCVAYFTKPVSGIPLLAAIRRAASTANDD